LSNPSISDRACWSPDFSAAPIPMESCCLAKTRVVLSFTPVTMLQASAQAVDFKVGRYFGEGQVIETDQDGYEFEPVVSDLLRERGTRRRRGDRAPTQLRRQGLPSAFPRVSASAIRKSSLSDPPRRACHRNC